VLFADLASVSAAVAGTRSRKRKAELLGDALRRLAPDEVEAGVAYLSGELRQRRTGVGWAALRDTPAPAGEPSLQVNDVDAALETIAALSGPGSQTARRDAVNDLFARATATEQDFLRALISGGVRQGALAGVMADAVAQATGLPRAKVDRANMLCGNPRVVAEAALSEGEAGLERFRLEIGRPLGPMLASPAASLEEAMAKVGEGAVDWKLDGARIQVHRDGDDVAIYSRSLDDLTSRLPEVVAAARQLPARRAVLDGEAIALRADGRPRPFQVTASRFGSRRDVGAQRQATPLTPFLFDVLHLDGDDLLDAPLDQRAERLDVVVPERFRPGRAPTSGARALLEDALARGHEGAMVKALGAPWVAGRRGGDWLKVKPVHTLDLVVLAAEWGHGRRRGFLSNLHLGARDGDGWAMLGKTFKGLTDALLTWQTERLLALETHRDRYVVRVRPELVVEIAFDGVQRSTRYPSGLALRFARVKRYREDKTAAEADGVDLVRALLPDDG
jgi:DNA ligase 1